MAEAYIIDAVRTPVGRRGGALANEHPADLGAHVLNALDAIPSGMAKAIKKKIAP